MAKTTTNSTPYKTRHEIDRKYESCGVIYQNWKSHGLYERTEENEEGGYEVKYCEEINKHTHTTDRQLDRFGNEFQQREISRVTYEDKSVRLKTDSGYYSVSLRLQTHAEQKPLRIYREKGAPLKLATTETENDSEENWTVEISATVMITNTHAEPARFLQFENVPGSRFPLNPRQSGEITLVYEQTKGEPDRAVFKLPRITFNPPSHSKK